MATKKLYFMLSILLSMVGTKVLAYDIAVENVDGVMIYYNFINEGTELEVTSQGTDAGRYSGSVNIPKSVTTMNETFNVTSIGSSAFSFCWSLTSITIPNSVTNIGSNAFYDSHSLTSVHISDLESWYNISFSDYSSNPLFYAHHLYINGSELTNLVIPNSMTSIGNYTFDGCSGLTSVTIPNSVTSIGKAAFGNCSGLTSISIPNSVTSLGEGAFIGCSGLTSFTIPNSVTRLADELFWDCSGLTSVAIPYSVTSIGNYTFNGCSGLTYVSIPNSVTSIGSGAFVLCSGLAHITIPGNVKSIGEFAFLSCNNLTEVISLNEDPIEISTNTFDSNTYSIATLYVPVGTIEKYRKIDGWNYFDYIEEGNGSGNNVIYRLIYKVDGEVYKIYELEEGIAITPEPAPTKEGYTFSGWSDIPKTMPAKDVTVTGSFIKNEVPEQDEITQDNILYRIDRGYASVIQADNVSGDIKIEESVIINDMNYEVTAIAPNAFKGCAEITSVGIPNSVATIGDYAFDGCTALHLITIGSGIKEIGVRSFANISKSYAGTRSDDYCLHIYFDAESVPTTNSGAFEDTDIANATLHVRDEMVNTFKAFNPWSNFGTIIGFSDTSIRTINIDTSDALIFDMHGNRLNYPRKGVNIIRMNNGKTKKLIVK